MSSPANRRNPTLNIEAPIIIIGNGGSGSSLLDRMLDAHPDISMKGEMKFLLPRAWTVFWEADANTKLRNLQADFTSDPGLENRITTSADEYQRFIQTLERHEHLRTAGVLRQTLDSWFLLSETEIPFWGFKEIMNGAVHYHAWDVYDYLFPRAVWLHIVRHPLHQIRSQARLSNQPLTADTAKEFLSHWLAIVRMSRRRSATGYYHEIRYEDLIQAPQLVLTPLLQDLELSWHEEMRLPLARQWGAKSAHDPLPADIHQIVTGIDELQTCMEALDYRCYDESIGRLVPIEPQPPAPQLACEPGGPYRFAGVVFHEQGKCWEFNFSSTAFGDKLTAVADDIGFWKRSPLRLFEDSKPLGPAHALHFLIRETGCGAYSHWQNRLLFSTSDNTNPNTNGRTYRFDLEG